MSTGGTWHQLFAAARQIKRSACAGTLETQRPVRAAHAGQKQDRHLQKRDVR